MKVLTIGASPYLIHSSGQIHAEILKHLYVQDIQVASVVWGHDITYHVPEEHDGKNQFFYHFNYQDQGHKIPIVPIQTDAKIVNNVYEIIRSMEPDIVVTVGRLADFPHMVAVKNFTHKTFKWILVLNNYDMPIPEEFSEVIESCDSIVCTNQTTADHLSATYNNIHFSYVGATDYRSYYPNKSNLVSASAKNSQSDNLPCLLEAATALHKSLDNFGVYVHANINEAGDYDLMMLKDRFDPQSQFVKYPDKYLSISDGLPREEYLEILGQSGIFISCGISHASFMTIFDAISCGCIPLMTKNSFTIELAKYLSNYLEDVDFEDLLVKSTPLMNSNHGYLYVCDPDELAKKILTLHTKISKNKGYKQGLDVIVSNTQRTTFLNIVEEVIKTCYRQPERLNLEVV